MRILVTGATGFVGSHLVPALIEEGHEVHVLHRKSSNTDKIHKEAKKVCFEDDVESLTEYMKNASIDGIIHLASLFLASHTAGQIKPMIESNILLGVCLLEAAVNADVKWFLNTGTIWQNYNSPDYSDEYHPVNLYAATKQAFMTMAQYYIEISSLKFVTLKLSDTYGAGDTRKKIINLFQEIAKSGETLDMSPGEQRISLVNIKDVVEGYKVLIRQFEEGIAMKKEYTLNSAEFVSLRQLAGIFEKETDSKLHIRWGGRPYRQREVMMPYRGTIPLHWTPNLSLSEGLTMFNMD